MSVLSGMLVFVDGICITTRRALYTNYPLYTAMSSFMSPIRPSSIVRRSLPPITEVLQVPAAESPHPSVNVNVLSGNQQQRAGTPRPLGKLVSSVVMIKTRVGARFSTATVHVDASPGNETAPAGSAAASPGQKARRSYRPHPIDAFAKRKQRQRTASLNKKFSAESSFLEAVTEKASFLMEADEAEAENEHVQLKMAPTRRVDAPAVGISRHSKCRRSKTRILPARGIGSDHRRNATPAADIEGKLHGLTQERVSAIEGKLDNLVNAFHSFEKRVSMTSSISTTPPRRDNTPVAKTAASDPLSLLGNQPPTLGRNQPLAPIEDYRQQKPPPLKCEI
jgi:hypothetical protein